MGNYQVPDEIRSFKPTDIPTVIKNIKGHFYVYEHLRITDEVTGKRKNATGKYLGKITKEDGFIPTGTSVSKDDITILNYGEYAIALNNSSCVLERLKCHFNLEDAIRLYCLAIIYFVNGYTYIRDISSYYEQSYLAICYPNLSMGEASIRSFFQNLGMRHRRIEAFEQSLIDDGSGLYAVDGHVIMSCSFEGDLSAYGNKYRALGNKQQNFMLVFDVERNRPMTCQAFDGGTPDKTAVKDLFCTYKFENTTFIVDSGFYSKQNITLFSRNNNHYVIPLPANTTLYRHITRSLGFTGEFLYKKGTGKKSHSSLISYRDVQFTTGRRVIMFRDNEMALRLCAEYRSQIGTDSSHTEIRYQELKKLFGVILLETNLQSPPEYVYATYKKRWRIETFYNHVKNRENFHSTHKQDYFVIQGESFIMVLEGLIYSSFMDTLHSSTEKILSGKSHNECIAIASHLKISKHSDGTWHKNHIRSSVVKLLEALNVKPQLDFK